MAEKYFNNLYTTSITDSSLYIIHLIGL